ncbi:MAG: acyltransferase [Pseudomonadota bacterium]
MSEQAAAWQRRPEAGSTGGLRFLLWVARHLGRGLLHAILAPVACYFFVVRGPERRASRHYLNKVLAKPVRWWHVIYHFYTFACATADRFYFLAAPERVPVRFVPDPALLQLLEENRVGLFLAAHFGSFEAARVLGPELGDINLRIVLDVALNQRIMGMLRQLEPRLAEQIIDSEQDPVALGLAIHDAIKNGDWVGLLADRRRAGDRVVPLPFLGEQAMFPAGAYVVAGLFKAPIICAFCRFDGSAYEVHCEVLTTAAALPRGDRERAIAELAHRYATRLEYHVKASPYAWFNFYDFWSD